MKRGIGLGVLLPEEPVIFPAPPPSLTHEVTLPEMVWKSQKKKKKASCETSGCETRGAAEGEARWATGRAPPHLGCM